MSGARSESLLVAESPLDSLNPSHPTPEGYGQQRKCITNDMTINAQLMAPTFTMSTNPAPSRDQLPCQTINALPFPMFPTKDPDASLQIPNLFDFNWGQTDFSGGVPAKESMMSLLAFESAQAMEDPRFMNNEMGAHAGPSTMVVDMQTPSMQPSPSESSVCSETTSNDGGTYSESETDDDEENDGGQKHDDQEPRRFPCRHNGCKNQFRSAHTRTLHEKAHTTKTPRAFVCSYPSCNVKISRRHDLLRHEVRKHGKKSEWQCEFCQTFFSSEKTQERHTCSKKTIQTSSSAGTTSCWKLPRQTPESQ